ncbi:MAG: dipeptidase, partial [Bifidobacteriaceae bacterium]|nr:dipeptidase [Bifidobacteriaceae bacterium]
IAALADAHFPDNQTAIGQYQEKTGGYGHASVIATDKALSNSVDASDATTTDNALVRRRLEQANQKLADQLRVDTDNLLDAVLYTTSMKMHNGFFLSDN